MLGWTYVGRNDPSWGETLAWHRRQQDYYRRKNDPIWKGGPLTSTDYIQIVKAAPQKAATIISNWKSQVQAVQDNHLYPAQGKLIESARLRDAALAEVQQLAEQTAVAADLARKALRHERDQKRPKVDPATYQQKVSQLRYLADHKVPIEQLVKDATADPASLRVAQEELPIIARAQNPLDPQAGEGIAAQLDHAAYEVYGGEYQQKADRLAQFEKGQYRAQVALTAAKRALMQDDHSEHPLPAYEEGQLLTA